MRPNEIQEIEEPLRLKVCPRCDYSLKGLPAVGACPECGRAYDQIGVYLYGDAAGARRNAWNSRVSRRRQLIWRGAFVVPLCGLILWEMTRARMRLLGWIQIAQFAIPFAIIFWRSLSDVGSGLVQVRLTPEGVRQGTRGLGPIPYEKVDDAKLIPWEKIQHIRFKAPREGLAEIQMARSAHSLRRRDYVHAIVQCSSLELEALAQRVAHWRIHGGMKTAIEPVAAG